MNYNNIYVCKHNAITHICLSLYINFKLFSTRCKFSEKLFLYWNHINWKLWLETINPKSHTYILYYNIFKIYPVTLQLLALYANRWAMLLCSILKNKIPQLYTYINKYIFKISRFSQNSDWKIVVKIMQCLIAWGKCVDHRCLPSKQPDPSVTGRLVWLKRWQMTPSQW